MPKIVSKAQVEANEIKVRRQVQREILNQKLNQNVKPKSKRPTSLSELPDDITVQVWRIEGLWEVILYCHVLHVCLGSSDREPKLEMATQQALDQYALNKKLV